MFIVFRRIFVKNCTKISSTVLKWRPFKILALKTSHTLNSYIEMWNFHGNVNVNNPLSQFRTAVTTVAISVECDMENARYACDAED
jgi:hypothetical protein